MLVTKLWYINSLGFILWQEVSISLKFHYFIWISLFISGRTPGCSRASWFWKGLYPSWTPYSFIYTFLTCCSYVYRLQKIFSKGIFLNRHLSCWAFLKNFHPRQDRCVCRARWDTWLRCRGSCLEPFRPMSRLERMLNKRDITRFCMPVLYTR